MKDFLSIRSSSTDEIRELLASAFAIKANPSKYEDRLKGKALAMIFEKPSLRTRVTFDVGMHQMGGYAVYLTPAEINLGKRESVADVARNLERMVQGIMIRTFSQELVEKLAECARIPVINGLTDHSHPCQAMADYMTVLEVKGSLQNLKIAYVGDGNNVAHSLICGAARLGAHIAVATPDHYAPAPEIVAWAKEQAGTTGARVVLMRDPVEAVAGADVVYTDTWTSMGQEEEAEQRRAIFWRYQVNDELLSHAKSDVVFMHCLPAHRGEEVTDNVIDSSASVVFQQAENRLHVQKAILLSLLG
ncbi:MAG TPA: ornithine carbamoyltransferase [Acidobacteriota bacterium]|nr:ornithine carbamoyltransferase [Acidobacteriota bacterium]